MNISEKSQSLVRGRVRIEELPLNEFITIKQFYRGKASEVKRTNKGEEGNFFIFIYKAMERIIGRDCYLIHTKNGERYIDFNEEPQRFFIFEADSETIYNTHDEILRRAEHI